MSPVSLILNILWIVFGGAFMAFGWLVAGLIMVITIVGIPWAASAFRIARYSLLPFGYDAVRRNRADLGTGPVGFAFNIVWLVLAGWWLALGHLASAAVLVVTIIGLPFAWAHLKLALLSLWPMGSEIVAVD